MLGRTYDSEVCSAARALEVVGERWSLLIVRNALFAGSTRYNDFRRRLGIATNILKTRLDALVDAGVMERRAYSADPELFDYLLTEKGRALGPVILALTEWGDRWLAPDGPPVRYTHAACGGAVTQHTVCTGCGEVTEPGEVLALPGPAMPPERAARMRSYAAGLVRVPPDAAGTRSAERPAG